MRPWSGLGSRIVKAIEARQRRKQEQAQGAHGDFYRSGGNRQLYEQLPVTDTDWIWDVGGYHGEWTAGMLARYGCHSDVFEPVPAFIEACQQLFAHNRRVRLHAVGLGEKRRTTRFSLLETGTSEFSSSEATTFTAEIVSVVEELHNRITIGEVTDQPGAIGCLKLNIEGGEYSVLEKLIETGEISRFRCLLIQFHRQPLGYQSRYTEITRRLPQTHRCVFAYPFVWERWDLLT